MGLLPFSTPPLPSQTGNSGKYLTTNGSIPSWGNVSGGQTLVTMVVATSGGDYTSLTAALAAASAGNTIYIKAGTYTEAGVVSSSLANLHIIGENPQTSVIAMGANSLTLSGAGVKVENLGFTFTSGSLNLTGSGSQFADNVVNHTGAGGVSFNANKQNIRGNSCITTDTTNHTAFYFGGSAKLIEDNYFEFAPSSSTSMELSSTYSNFTGNILKILSTGGNNALEVDGNNLVISGNLINNTGATNGVMVRFSGTTNTSFTGNTIIDGNTLMNIRSTSHDNVISGNMLRRTLTGASGNMILIATDSYLNQITGNYLFDVAAGGAVTLSNTYTANNYQANSVVGNTIYRNVSGTVSALHMGTGTCSGNFINSAGSNTVTLAGSNCVVTGNTIYSGSGADIVISANYQVITGNQFLTYPTSTGISFSTYIGVLATDNGLPESLNRVVMKMKNTSGVTITAGEVVVIKAVAAGNEITTTTTVSDGSVWGMSEESISNNGTGFVLTTGKTSLLKVNGTTDIAIGDFITTYSVAGIGAKAALGTTGVTPGDLAIAYALEAYTGNDSNGVIDAILVPARRM